jgi:hypothetical protein
MEWPASKLTPLKADAWQILLQTTNYASVSEKHPGIIKQIIRGITHGVPIEFTGNREIDRVCNNLRVEAKDIPKISKVIADDVAAGKKAGPFSEKPFKYFSCSPIGCVPKHGTEAIRCIHHLSFPRGGDSINGSTVEESHELGSLDRATYFIKRIGKGCFLIKLDVKAAYKIIPVDPNDWPLLGFKWEGKWYYERVLPFGLRSSCRLWEMYATALQHIFEKAVGIKCIVHYVDDFLFVVSTLEEGKRNLTRALMFAERLGVPFAPDKQIGPVTKLTFLGIELDTIQMTARLDDSRLERLRLLFGEWKEKKQATIAELHSLEGVLQWCCKVVRPGRSFLSRIRKWRQEQQTKGEGPHVLTQQCLADIDWWRTFLSRWNGISLYYDEEWSEAEKLEIFTDACELGWGVRFGDKWVKGKWTQEQWNRASNPTRVDELTGEKRRSMPFLELLAVVIACSSFGRYWQGRKIRFRVDCSPVVANINKRSSPADRAQGPLRHMATLAAEHGFDFDCVWIKGAKNIAADALSRDNMCAFIKEVPSAETAMSEYIPPPAFEWM